MTRAILEGKNVIPIHDLFEWAKWFETADRQIDVSQVGGYMISTIFLGIDHGFGGRPLWFETMVFGGEKFWRDYFEEQYMERYETFDEAKAGHERITNLIKSGDKSFLSGNPK